MRFLANENFPVPSIRFLQTGGYDVASVILVSPGIDDRLVLQWAKEEERIILTFDKDYGELLFKYKLSPPKGVIFFRYDPLYPQEPGEHLTRLFKSKELFFDDKFTTLDREHVRQRAIITR